LELITTYFEALRLLSPEKNRAIGLALANLILGLIQLAEPFLFGRVVDALAQGTPSQSLILSWAGLGAFGIFAGVFVAVGADRLAHRLRLQVLAQGFESVITLPFHAQKASGQTVRTLLAGSDALFWMWLTFLREHLAALISIVFLIPIALRMNIAMAAVLGLLATFYTFANLWIVSKSQIGQEAVEGYNAGVFGHVGDVIGNLTVVQGFGRIHHEMMALQTLMADLLKAQYPVLTWWAVLTVLTRSAATLAMVALFALGSHLASQGSVTLGEIVSFVGFATLLIGKLDQLSSFTVRIFTQLPTIRHFITLLESGSHSLQISKPIRPLVLKEGHVRFENVHYRYPDSDQGVFGLDFDVAPGETVALVGRTGSGKTTTLLLLERLLEADSGRILIDDQDIATSDLASLRQSMAVVFQDAGLFNRSIFENIRVGKPDASPEEVFAAARKAEAEAFILRKPEGYGFVIGEQGMHLSGGERQRLAIARAFLKEARILILDEATSALDTWTESRIQSALTALRKNRTTFVIAHRLSTVRTADRILVLDQGRIIEQGDFQTLAQAQGEFAEMLRQGGFLSREKNSD
jgi:ATP-binding cassette subfamily B protein